MKFPGRGATINPRGRFESLDIQVDDEFLAEAGRPRTQYLEDDTQTIITRNSSPDIGFNASINPYRGCEHGCSYCYARPYHEYLGFSAGQDFETRILVKTKAPDLLRAELSAAKWKPEALAMSGITDCYQPIEKKLEITRGCLRVLSEFRNPVGIVTKNHLVTRDLDYLTELSHYQCIRIYISVTSLDSTLAAKLEPRASFPQHRLDAVRQLSQAGIPVGVLMAPIIPGLNEHEIPAVLEAAREAGATRAGYTIIRLPYGVKDVFAAWLEAHFPEAREKILNRIRSMRGGKLNDSRFGKRFEGEGLWAEQIAQLFEISSAKFGLNQPGQPLSTASFRNPADQQMRLF